jgi:hypothetical protein
VTPGTYTWTWGTGANADSFTLNIGVSSVPEPSSLVLTGSALGFLALGTLARRASRGVGGRKSIDFDSHDRDENRPGFRRV